MAEIARVLVALVSAVGVEVEEREVCIRTLELARTRNVDFIDAYLAVRATNAAEPVQGRIHIEKINEPFLFRDGGSPAEYGAGLKLAIDRGWLSLHESGTFVTFTPAGAELFA